MVIFKNMRKFLSIVSGSVLLLAASCNMDLRPYSTIDPDNAISSITDAGKLRNYFYVNMRGLTSGSYIYATELQADMFHAAADYGNNYGDLYRWDFTSELGDAQSIWGSCYGVMANNNFFLEAAKKFETTSNADPKTKLSAEDSTTLYLYMGEAHFQRAFLNFTLAQYFCDDYVKVKEEGKLEQAYGLPIVTKYAPTSDEKTYPGRASMAETFKFICADLDTASMYIKTKPEKGAKYITSDVVKALRSRVELYMGNYQAAIDTAKSLYEGGLYPLVERVGLYDTLFRLDSGEECIMQLYASMSELPGATGSPFVGYDATSKNYMPLFIPTSAITELYDEDDFRFVEGFEKLPVKMSTSRANVYLCTKYPGNPSFYKGSTSNYCNSPKPFRMAEQYLILAEAYAQLGMVDEANSYLNELRSKRIPSYEEVKYPQEQLLTEIHKERQRELFAEGFRFFDLRRYRLGMERAAAQDASIIADPGRENTEFKTVAADVENDHRWIWPIPLAETTSNPQIANQQNPRY